MSSGAARIDDAMLARLLGQGGAAPPPAADLTDRILAAAMQQDPAADVPSLPIWSSRRQDSTQGRRPARFWARTAIGIGASLLIGTAVAAGITGALAPVERLLGAIGLTLPGAADAPAPRSLAARPQAPRPPDTPPRTVGDPAADLPVITPPSAAPALVVPPAPPSVAPPSLAPPLAPPVAPRLSERVAPPRAITARAIRDLPRPALSPPLSPPLSEIRQRAEALREPDVPVRPALDLELPARRLEPDPASPGAAPRLSERIESRIEAPVPASRAPGAADGLDAPAVGALPTPPATPDAALPAEAESTRPAEALQEARTARAAEREQLQRLRQLRELRSARQAREGKPVRRR